MIAIAVLQALEGRDVARGHTEIVGQLGRLVVGIGADEGNALNLLGIEGQHIALVLEQHHRLTCHEQGMPTVGLTLYHLTADTGIGHHLLGVVHAQLHLDGEQAGQGGVDVALGMEPLLHALGQELIEVATLQVGAGQHGITGGHDVVGMCLVITGKVGHGPAVGGYIALELPLVAQDVHQQGVVAAARLSVHTVVGTHHAMHTGLAHKVAEGGQIGVPQVVERRTRIEGMTHTLGTAVHGKMLGTGHGLQVMRVVALQTVHHGHAHLACQVGVLTVGLLSASPTRVAEDVDVGGPVGETVVLGHAALLQILVEEGAALGAGDIAHAAECLGVEGGGHADGLREHGDLFLGAGHTVERLVPPVISRYAQPLNGRGIVLHQFHLFLQGEAGDEVIHSLLDGEFGVAEGIIGGRLLRHSTHVDATQQDKACKQFPLFHDSDFYFKV